MTGRAHAVLDRKLAVSIGCAQWVPAWLLSRRTATVHGDVKPPPVEPGSHHPSVVPAARSPACSEHQAQKSRAPPDRRPVWADPANLSTDVCDNPIGPGRDTAQVGADVATFSSVAPTRIFDPEGEGVPVEPPVNAKPLTLELAAEGRVFCGRFDGSFVLRAFNGATLTGSATGSVCGGIRPLSLTLTAEGGNRQFRQLTVASSASPGRCPTELGVESAFTGALARL